MYFTQLHSFTKPSLGNFIDSCDLKWLPSLFPVVPRAARVPFKPHFCTSACVTEASFLWAAPRFVFRSVSVMFSGQTGTGTLEHRNTNCTATTCTDKTRPLWSSTTLLPVCVTWTSYRKKKALLFPATEISKARPLVDSDWLVSREKDWWPIRLKKRNQTDANRGESLLISIVGRSRMKSAFKTLIYIYGIIYI